MVKLVDTLDLGSSTVRCESSSLSLSTVKVIQGVEWQAWGDAPQGYTLRIGIQS